MSTIRSPSEFKLLPEAGMTSELQLFKAPFVVQYLATFAMTAIATVVAVGLDSAVTIPNLSLVFVVPVIIAAVAFGLGPSLCSAILGALAFNFFLTAPYFTLHVDDPANIWAIGLLFVVGTIASAVASTARRKADEAALAQRRAEIMQAFGRDIVAAGETKAMFSQAANALEALFRVPVVVMLISDGSAEVVERRGAIEPGEADFEAARSSLATGKAVMAGIYPFDASRFDFWPVTTSAEGHAVIGVAFDPDERPPQPAILVDVLRGLLALALDRRQLATERRAL